jgi:hypothetical protein
MSRAKITTSLEDLAAAGVQWVTLTAKGYRPERRKGAATHKLIDRGNSVLLTPRRILKRSKRPLSSFALYGNSKYNNTQDRNTIMNVPPIPTGATHLEASNSRVAIVDAIKNLHEFTGYRSFRIRFGRLVGHEFRSMMPPEHDFVPEDGRCNPEIKDSARAVVLKPTAVPPKVAKRLGLVDTTPAPSKPLPVRGPGGKTVKPTAKPVAAPAKAGKPQPPVPAKKGPAKAPKPAVAGAPVPKTAFIDALIIKGGLTKLEIHTATMKAYPDADPKSTMTTIGIRPTMIRGRGLVAQPFKK